MNELRAALQARAGQAPPFHAVLAAAEAIARRRAAGRPPAWQPALAAACVLATLAALLVPWQRSADELQLQGDLRLAHEFSPERQWRTGSDALLAGTGYRTPVIVELPVLDNPFKESLL